MNRVSFSSFLCLFPKSQSLISFFRPLGEGGCFEVSRAVLAVDGGSS